MFELHDSTVWEDTDSTTDSKGVYSAFTVVHTEGMYVVDLATSCLIVCCCVRSHHAVCIVGHGRCAERQGKHMMSMILQDLYIRTSMSDVC